MEIFIEYFYEVVYCFQVAQIIVIDVDTYTEVQASVPAVHYLKVAELKIIENMTVTITERSTGLLYNLEKERRTFLNGNNSLV